MDLGVTVARQDLVSYACLYLPRTYRHLKEVAELLSKQERFCLDTFGEVDVHNLAHDDQSVSFRLTLSDDTAFLCEFYLPGLLTLAGPREFDASRLFDIGCSLYGYLASEWKVLRDQLAIGAIEYGRCLGVTPGPLEAGRCFLECSTDFVERLAERHRHSYPFGDVFAAGATTDASDAYLYVWEIPQLVQRARQALTCLECAKRMFSHLDDVQLRAVEQEHHFVLDYLQLLNEAAAAYHSHRIVQTQLELNRSQLELNRSMLGLNRNIRVLSVLMVLLAGLSVVVALGAAMAWI